MSAKQTLTNSTKNPAFFPINALEHKMKLDTFRANSCLTNRFDRLTLILLKAWKAAGKKHVSFQISVNFYQVLPVIL
jgi:hypothetical protein